MRQLGIQINNIDNFIYTIIIKLEKNTNSNILIIKE